MSRRNASSFFIGRHILSVYGDKVSFKGRRIVCEFGWSFQPSKALHEKPGKASGRVFEGRII
jgi:hypothetical protein